MPHELQFTTDNYGDGTQILFTCVVCQKEIAFARQGDGDPCATLIDGVWHPPENPEQWLGPCANPDGSLP